MTAPIANVAEVDFSYTAPNVRMEWVGTGDSYQVRYRDLDNEIWSDPLIGTDDTGITISGLTEGKHYDFEVVTHVDGTPPKIPDADSIPDYWGYVVPQGLTPPTDCEVISESATQIHFSWNGNSNTSDNFLVSWEDDLGETNQIMVTAQTEVVIGDLDPERSYKFYISAVKDDEVVPGDCYIDKSKDCCD